MSCTVEEDLRAIVVLKYPSSILDEMSWIREEELYRGMIYVDVGLYLSERKIFWLDKSLLRNMFSMSKNASLELK